MIAEKYISKEARQSDRDWKLVAIYNVTVASQIIENTELVIVARSVSLSQMLLVSKRS